eukprot:COSAG02_NODE_11445_length_1723_cov_0.982143_2_plen_194_part_00
MVGQPPEYVCIRTGQGHYASDLALVALLRYKQPIRGRGVQPKAQIQESSIGSCNEFRITSLMAEPQQSIQPQHHWCHPRRRHYRRWCSSYGDCLSLNPICARAECRTRNLDQVAAAGAVSCHLHALTIFVWRTACLPRCQRPVLNLKSPLHPLLSRVPPHEPLDFLSDRLFPELICIEAVRRGRSNTACATKD